MNTLEEAIFDGWSWKLTGPIEVIETNLFGNTILKAGDGLFYRIIPEDLSCDLIAKDKDELNTLRTSPDFITDWEMQSLVAIAEEKEGKLGPGQCYHLAIPSVLGGAYSRENIRKISMVEWLSFSGDGARQIEGLPDGTKLELKITR